VEELKTHFMFDNFLFFENRGVYEMWKNTVDPDRPQMTIWRMRIPCWIPRATNTLSEYVILIAFPLQQWLHERASELRHTLPVLFFFKSSRTDLRPNSHPRLFPTHSKGRGTLTTHLYTVPRFRKYDAIPQLIHLQGVVRNSAQLHFSILVSLSMCYSSLQMPRT